MTKKQPKTELLIAFANNNLEDVDEKDFIKNHIEECDTCFQKVTDFGVHQMKMEEENLFLQILPLLMKFLMKSLLWY